MPYKIYTYEDPYKLDQTDFWPFISSLPHFCASRTLVNGLKDNIQDSIHGLICPLEDLINQDTIYGNWTNSIDLRIQQYTILSSVFNELYNRNEIDKNFYSSLIQNQNHFLDAIRLFIELGIPSSSLDSSKGNKEQMLFVKILSRLQNNPAFKFPKVPNKDIFISTLIALAEEEKETYVKNTPAASQRMEDELVWYNSCIDTTKSFNGETIVIHGVNQFTPAQLRLITELDKKGTTIIFLFNYQNNYPNMYSSWLNIYRNFGVPIVHDSQVKEYVPISMPNASNSLARAFGAMYENNSTISKEQKSQWYQLYKDIPYFEFANITEYAHYVSRIVEKAKKNPRYIDSTSNQNRNEFMTNAQLLSSMDEQVYTANRDIHTLMKIYYPEFTQSRHFLSYPIGQFFSAVYQLWDYEAGAIKIDIPLLKECLFSGVLSSGKAENLLRTFCNLEIIFEEISTYDDFKKQIANDYQQKYDDIYLSRGDQLKNSLKSLSIYNQYLVPQKDLKDLINAIEEINEIATSLFSIDSNHKDYIDFGKHFEKLENFLKHRELNMASQEERKLINDLLSRLNQIHPERSNFSGTFRDLKESLYYYLKQQDDENTDPNWIIRNFEQIDGDILRSKGQFKNGTQKIYHFACLSDQDMNKSINELLPWPLTDHFIQMAYSPEDLQFQVYYTTLEEHSNFLRFALFYGAFFNLCDIHLSYVKQNGDELVDPYTPLLILGLKPKAESIESDSKNLSYKINIKGSTAENFKFDSFQMMDFYLCPYRYFLDYVMESSPVIREDFLYQKYFENLLIEGVWKDIEKTPKTNARERLNRTLETKYSDIEPYFNFWKRTKRIDIRHRAYNYVYNMIIPSGKSNLVPAFNQEHMKIRRLFGKAKFEIDISEIEPKSPYDSFEKLAERKYPRKTYSLHKIQAMQNSKQNQNLLLSDLSDYINERDNIGSSKASAIPAEWCNYCVHKENCMEYYLSENQV